ncbi:hypothetical protein BDZ94DRAFT_1170561 [Collybia nuda]|uniref:DUF6593 domain-containing protein n=1 Tax=Collybia nuda TaxID=64659 RepID=A0A9P6CBX6_9AGAR|nr:hypothetical protein BDZ94DRAFT_1170561 [Collybia nuda]
MFYNNPYGAWADAGQQPSAAWGESVPPPSIFGALPTPSMSPSPNMAVFHATSFSPTIFNSTVVGPQGQVYFHIVTDNELSGYTVFKDAQNKSVALIEWKTPPTVELRGVMSGSARSWLKLSPDRSSRSMEIRGMRYTWAPHNQAINLYVGEGHSATFLARVSRTKSSLAMELTPHASQLGLLNSIVVAAFLLQCGRNID